MYQTDNVSKRSETDSDFSTRDSDMTQQPNFPEL